MKHPGFKAVEAKVAREPGIRNAGAVVAAAARNASPEAKRRNPRLRRVKGRARPMHQQIGEKMLRGY